MFELGDSNCLGALLLGKQFGEHFLVLHQVEKSDIVARWVWPQIWLLGLRLFHQI
jgi:hypothetical protein